MMNGYRKPIQWSSHLSLLLQMSVEHNFFLDSSPLKDSFEQELTAV